MIRFRLFVSELTSRSVLLLVDLRREVFYVDLLSFSAGLIFSKRKMIWKTKQSINIIKDTFFSGWSVTRDERPSTNGEKMAR